MTLLYGIVLVVFAGVAGVVYAGLSSAFSEERQVSRRLRKMSEYEASQAAQVEPLLRPFSERVFSPITRAAGALMHRVAPRGYMENLRRRLVIAGSPRGMDAERFVAVKIIGTIGVLGLAIGMSVLRPISAAGWLFVVLPVLALAFFGPGMWLSNRIAQRQLTIRRELPDMLDMLTISVEAGLGFDAALAKLVANTRGPLAVEFARVLQEVQAGAERAEALRHLAQRTEAPELDTFIMAIVQAEVFGISVSSVLRAQAVELRLRRRQLAEEIAQKAPVRLVFPLVLCILPATLIVILGPAVVRIINAFG